MKQQRSRVASWIGVGACVALCALGGSAWAGPDAAAASEAWQPVADESLETLRGGLRWRGLDVDLDVLVRDLVDGRELARRSFGLGDAAGERLALPPLVNQRDGAQIVRDATIEVRIPGFRSAFGSSSRNRVRARIERSLH